MTTLASRLSADNKMKAVEQAQMVVSIKLGIWLRDPSKQARADLDEALIDFDDVVAKIVSPGERHVGPIHQRPRGRSRRDA